MNYNNIIPNNQVINQFHTYTQLGLGGFEIGGLDFGSVMMYGSFDFSNNGLPTITRLDSSTFFSQRVGLSAGDIQTYNNMYNRPFMRMELENCQTMPIQNGTQRTCEVFIRAYADAAMTIPATLTFPVVFKVTTEWFMTGQQPWSSISEKTMQPGEHEYYCGLEVHELTAPGGQIFENDVWYVLNQLMH